MQKHVNLVDLVKSFPTNIYLQNLASIQKRTSPAKFAHLAEKSGKGSISNLSTKVLGAARRAAAGAGSARGGRTGWGRRAPPEGFAHSPLMPAGSSTASSFSQSAADFPELHCEFSSKYSFLQCTALCILVMIYG